MSRTSPIRPHDSRKRENTSFTRKRLSLLQGAIKCLLRNPTRSCIALICMTALLSPFVTAIAICEGVKQQYRTALKAGGELYVARDHYGSNAPIELKVMESLRAVQGVTRVVPRVIGRTYVKGKFIAILGISSSFIPSSVKIMNGRGPMKKGEVLLGWRAAEHLKLRIGSRFSIKRNTSQIFQIVGIFDSPFSIWSSDLLLMTFEDASTLFGLEGKATDLLVFTRPGYGQIVDVIVRMSEQEGASGQPLLRVQNRELIDRYSRRGFNIKAGVFSGFYCLVFALAIPSIGVISGFGLSERRREIGVMKAVGWQTQEVLEMVAMENLFLSMISMPFILLLSALWIHLFNGAVIAKFFIPGIAMMIPFPVPSKIFPIPCLLGIMMAMILTMVGSIYSTWRTAIVPPWEAMKK